MKGWPLWIATVAICVLASRGFAQVGEGEVTVQLVPEHAGPYVPGEHLTVDVFLEQSFEQDLRLDLILFDFTLSDGALLFDPDFVFDLNGYDEVDHDVFPALPLPAMEHTPDCICPFLKLPLSMSDSLHIGSFGVTVPESDGVYSVDLLNAAASPGLGARCTVEQEVSPWSSAILRANEGRLLGGALALVVETPPIPAVSEWGMLILGLFVAAAATLMLAKSVAPEGDEA